MRMTFGSALALLKDGHEVAREGWNGKGMWISLLYPLPEAFITVPYIYIRTADGEYVPWLASQTDLLANDWVEV